MRLHKPVYMRLCDVISHEERQTDRNPVVPSHDAPTQMLTGYEDNAEFEDALNGSFSEFLKAMPHIDTMTDDQGRLVFKVRGDWRGRRGIGGEADTNLKKTRGHNSLRKI